MKIVIAGLGKSGTTALFFKLKQAMPSGTLGLFEPMRFDAAAHLKVDHVIAKIIVSRQNTPDYASFADFDRKIFIVRDPRDVLISRLLYQVFNRPDFCNDPIKVEQYLTILKLKEDAPAAVSMLDIIDTLGSLLESKPMNAIRRIGFVADDFQTRHPDYFLFRYEQLVADECAGLEDYLGLKLFAGPAVVADELARVTRTKDAGAWRNWLTPKDVEFFRPHFSPYLARHGYADDWTLSPTPRILPEHCTQYVQRVVDERRQAR